MNIKCSSDKPSYISNLKTNDEIKPNEIPKVMIPVGGGKDSAVTIELLKDKADIYCYIINSRDAKMLQLKLPN